jgi:hypothetical protein
MRNNQAHLTGEPQHRCGWLSVKDFPADLFSSMHTHRSGHLVGFHLKPSHITSAGVANLSQKSRLNIKSVRMHHVSHQHAIHRTRRRRPTQYLRNNTGAMVFVGGFLAAGPGGALIPPYVVSFDISNTFTVLRRRTAEKITQPAQVYGKVSDGNPLSALNDGCAQRKKNPPESSRRPTAGAGVRRG